MSENNKKYLAFISYRHADNKEPGRQWATWLHQAIETYQVPSDLVGTKNARGEEIPERIYPIFRDEEELPADADLGRSIVNALDNTRLLIVLCSPRAVASTYVADEIDYFKKSGHSDRIIAAMIDGEPNTSWDEGKQAMGFTAEQECFPVPLQFEYDSEGNRTDKHAEPIAADFRLNVDGTPQQSWTSVEAYKQTLQSDKSYDKEQVASLLGKFSQQQHLMLLKIIAGILGLPLGELTRRDKEYQLEIERQKAKKLRRWLSIVGVLALVAVITGAFAFLKQIEATDARQVAEIEKGNAESSLAEAYAGYGRNELQDKQFEEALLYFQHANQLSMGKVTAEEEFEARKQSLRKVWSNKRGVRFDGTPFVTANARYVAGRVAERAVLYDLESQLTTFSYPIVTKGDILLLTSGNGEYLFEFNTSLQKLRRINTKNNQSLELGWLVERGASIFWPSESGNELLVFLTSGDIELVDLVTKTLIDNVLMADILKVSPEFGEDLKQDWISAYSDFKVVNNGDAWTLVNSSGLTLRLTGGGQSSKQSTSLSVEVAENINVKIQAPLFSGHSDKFAISNDGKRIARIEYQTCQFLVGSSQDIDWMRVANHAEIWDLSTGKQLSRIAINWSEPTEFFDTTEACGENPDFEFNLTDSQRSIAGKVNNFLNDVSLFFGQDYDLSINANGNNYLLNEQKIPLSTHLRALSKKEFSKAASGNVVVIEKNLINSQFKTAYDGQFWVYRIEADGQTSQSMPVSSVLSFDNRFLVTLFSNGNIQARNLVNGDAVKQSITVVDQNYTTLCQTEKSHEVILVSQSSIERINWLNGKRLWKNAILPTRSRVTSCTSSLKLNEFSVVKSNSDKLKDGGANSDSQPTTQPTLIEDEHSQLLRYSLTGEPIETINAKDIALNRPLFVHYTDIENQVYIANFAGVMLFDTESKSIIDYLSLGRNSSEYGVPTSIETSSDYISTYVGYSNGKIYRFTNGNAQLLADLEMPVIDIILFGNIAKITTGFNPRSELQQPNLILLTKEATRSYSYELELSSLSLRKVRGYSKKIVERVNNSYDGYESLVEFTDGTAAYFRRSTVEPVISDLSSDTRRKKFVTTDQQYLTVEQSNQGLLLTSSSAEHQLEVPLLNSRGVYFSLLSNRKWLFIAIEDNSDLKTKTYLVNTETLTISPSLKVVDSEIGNRLSTVKLNPTGTRVISCDGAECALYDLNQVRFSQQFSSYEMEPSETIKLTEAISEVVFTNNSIVITTLTGKLQVWQKNTSGEIKQAKDIAEESINENGFFMLKERADRFFKNVIYSAKADLIFAADRLGASILKPDLSLVNRISENFSRGHVLRADLNEQWLLVVEKNGSGGTLNAQVYDYKYQQYINHFSIAGFSLMSMNHLDSEFVGVLSWTDNDGNLLEFDIRRAVDYGRKFVKFDHSQRINFTQMLSGKYLDKVSIFEMSNNNESGLWRNSKSESELTSRELLASNKKQLDANKLEQQILIPTERAYRDRFYDRLGLLSGNQWPKNERDLLDEKNLGKELMLQSPTSSLADSSRDLRLVSLEYQINKLFSENKDFTSFISELERIAPEHFFVRFSKLQKLFQVDSYQAYLYGIRYLQALGGRAPFNSELFEQQSSDDSRILIKGVDSTMLHKFSGGVFSAAIQSGLFRNAYELLKTYPNSFTNPQFSQQLLVQLTNLGLYEQAEFVLKRELSNLEKFGKIETNQRNKNTYQSYQRYQKMLHLYLRLRTELNELPKMCLGDIQPNSGIQTSNWKAGDCILKIDGQSPIDLASTFPKLQLASANQLDISVLREGKVLTLKAPTSLVGGAWHMVGYPGRYVIKVKTVKSGSLAQRIGIQAEDYLLAVDGQLIGSPLQVMRIQTTNNLLLGILDVKPTVNSKLSIYRTKGRLTNQIINPSVQALVGSHPLSFFPGDLIEVELSEYEELGISIEMALLLAPTK